MSFNLVSQNQPQMLARNAQRLQLQSGGGQARELIMHCLMYGTSLYSELADLMAQTKNNKFKVTYLSGALSQIQLFIEFFFEVINERDEPIVLVFEVAKAFFRFREYISLMRKEDLHVLIDFEVYKQYNLSEAYEQGLINLIRSNKTIKKPLVPATSSGLASIRKQQIVAKEKTLSQVAKLSSSKHK